MSSPNSLLQRLYEESGSPSLEGRDYISQILRRQVIGIRRSAEFQRIESLPRRSPLSPSEERDMVIRQTKATKKSGGGMELRFEQAWALSEMKKVKGLFGNIGCGMGKTLISLLAPKVLNAKRPLLLVPAQLKKKTEKFDIPFYQKHFDIPAIKVLSFSALSSVKQADFLEEYKPDVIICDEVHKLKSTRSARTRRVLRYLALHKEVVFVGLSGTMTRRSLKDYWHILRVCLGEANSPLPMGYMELNDWSLALDSGILDWQRLAPGALDDFCTEGETTREGYSRRLRDTFGVVSSDESSLDAGLEISPLRVPLPTLLAEKLQEMRDGWVTPNNEVITDPSGLWAHCVELAFGFFYKWVWPNGVVDFEWLEVRKEWRLFVQNVLRNNRRGYDSPLQVSNACANGEYPDSPYERWGEIKSRSKPKTEAEWVDETFLKEVSAKMSSEKFGGIVWVHHRTVGEKLSSLSGVPYFGAGDDTILDYNGPCIASIGAHGTGKNLQRYSQNILLFCPSAGATWEQLISRTHRPGQREDTVSFRVSQHTSELRNAFRKALRDATYIEKTMGQPQKLRLATINMGLIEDL